MLCQPCVSQTFLAEKFNVFFLFFCFYLDLPTASRGLDTWGADEKRWKNSVGGMKLVLAEGLIFDQSSLKKGMMKGMTKVWNGNAPTKVYNGPEI